MPTPHERTLASLASSAMIYRAFGLFNPYLAIDEELLLLLFERVFLLERQIALLEPERAAHRAASDASGAR